MSNRREMFAALGAAAVWPIVARAQQAAMPVIGFLGGGTPSTYASYLDGFRRGLVAAGEVEGRDVTIELHWLGGRYDQAPAVAEELVRRQVAVIVVSGSTAVALAVSKSLPSLHAIVAS